MSSLFSLWPHDPQEHSHFCLLGVSHRRLVKSEGDYPEGLLLPRSGLPWEHEERCPKDTERRERCSPTCPSGPRLTSQELCLPWGRGPECSLLASDWGTCWAFVHTAHLLLLGRRSGEGPCAPASQERSHSCSAGPLSSPQDPSAGLCRPSGGWHRQGGRRMERRSPGP